MKVITRYQCEFCNSEYETEADAYTCEDKPDPIEGNDLNIGDTLEIKYEEKSNNQFTYSTGEAEIKEKVKASVGTDLDDRKHIWFLIVKMGKGLQSIKRGVFLTDNEGWFSPIEHSYGLFYTPAEMSQFDLKRAIAEDNDEVAAEMAACTCEADPEAECPSHTIENGEVTKRETIMKVLKDEEPKAE